MQEIIHVMYACDANSALAVQPDNPVTKGYLRTTRYVLSHYIPNHVSRANINSHKYPRPRKPQPASTAPFASDTKTTLVHKPHSPPKLVEAQAPICTSPTRKSKSTYTSFDGTFPCAAGDMPKNRCSRRSTLR